MINLITLPIITLVLLILQAMFAGSEISLLSCDKGRIRSKADQGLPSAKLVMSSINKIEEYVATSLVGENLCIVINTVLVSSFVETAYPQYDPHNCTRVGDCNCVAQNHECPNIGSTT